MKNREITKDEINKITDQCHSPREKAFFAIMRQSGLPPHAIKQLKIKHLEKILEPNTPIPCKITVPHERTPTFIGHEAFNYLKQYLEHRPELTQESLLFTIQNKPSKQINTKDVSRTFKQTAQELERKRKITYEVKKGKPSELRLYSLINFYRKNAKYYLTELKNTRTPKDDEFYRQLYEKKAMPHLEIEPLTPIQTLKHQVEKQHNEIQNLKNITERLQFQLEISAQGEWQQLINEMTKPPEEARKNRLLTPEAYKIIRIEAPKSNKPYTQRLLELYLEQYEKTLENIKKSNIENKELHITDFEKQIEYIKMAISKQIEYNENIQKTGK
jgi:hypothetical protein